jgi:hypothetical protein
MIRRRWLAPVVLGVVLMGGCAQQAALSGDIVVPTPSGQLTQAADVEVALIPADAEFESSWAALLSQFRADHDRARSAWQSAWLSYREASAQRERISESYLKDVFNLSVAAEYGDAASLALRAVHRIDESREQLRHLTETYTRLALGAIRARQFVSTRTDANGHYEIRNVPPGRYYVFAGHETRAESQYWIVRAEIGPDPVELRLTDSNRNWPLVAAAN